MTADSRQCGACYGHGVTSEGDTCRGCSGHGHTST